MAVVTKVLTPEVGGTPTGKKEGVQVGSVVLAIPDEHSVSCLVPHTIPMWGGQMVLW